MSEENPKLTDSETRKFVADAIKAMGDFFEAEVARREIGQKEAGLLQQMIAVNLTAFVIMNHGRAGTDLKKEDLAEAFAESLTKELSFIQAKIVDAVHLQVDGLVQKMNEAKTDESLPK